MTRFDGTAGRFIADALAAAGVRIAFTVPGESFLPLLDGMAAAGIRVVATRHEGGAGFMAHAHGALTGRPAAVLATRAVGAANLAIALHSAQADSVPLVALVGQVERPSRGHEAFQEADLVAGIGGLCRWAREVRDVTALPGALDEALRRATTSRPGPVMLSLPADLLEEPAPADGGRIATSTVLGPPRAPEPDSTTVRRVLHLLLDAQRPVILAGAGVLRSRATADLVRFAEMVDVPVMTAWRRPDAFPNDHALYLGMTGLFAAPTVRPRLADADAVLVLGCRLNEVASYGWSVPSPGARWAHVDLEPLGTRGAQGAPTIALAADARTFIREARRVIGGGALEATSVQARRARNVEDRAAYEAARVVEDGAWDGPGVHPGRVVAALGRALPPDAIVTTDAGHFGGWAARGLWMRRPGTFLGSTAGAMGYGLPAAIAASLASPGRPVVALVGDGGLGMVVAELETAVREGAHPIVLVFDNARYGTIWDHQRRRAMAPVATDLGPVDWVAVAEGFGAAGVRVDSDEAFEPALRGALASRQPTVIHLVVDRRWVSVDRPDGTYEPEAEPEPEPAMALAALDLEPPSEPEPAPAPIAPLEEPEPEPEPVETGLAADVEPAEAEPEAEPSVERFAAFDSMPEAERLLEARESEIGPAERTLEADGVAVLDAASLRVLEPDGALPAWEAEAEPIADLELPTAAEAESMAPVELELDDAAVMDTAEAEPVEAEPVTAAPSEGFEVETALGVEPGVAGDDEAQLLATSQPQAGAEGEPELASAESEAQPLETPSEA